MALLLLEGLGFHCAVPVHEREEHDDGFPITGVGFNDPSIVASGERGHASRDDDDDASVLHSVARRASRRFAPRRWVRIEVEYNTCGLTRQ